MPEVRCYSVNLSEGGMALSTLALLTPGEQAQVHFTLPGHKAPCLAESTILWRKMGRVGLRFDSLPQEHKSDLQVWLAQKLEELLPGFVTETFQKTDGRSVPADPDRYGH
jgi:hypothetical protein